MQAAFVERDVRFAWAMILEADITDEVSKQRADTDIEAKSPANQEEILACQIARWTQWIQSTCWAHWVYRVHWGQQFGLRECQLPIRKARIKKGATSTQKPKYFPIASQKKSLTPSTGLVTAHIILGQTMQLSNLDILHHGMPVMFLITWYPGAAKTNDNAQTNQWQQSKN